MSNVPESHKSLAEFYGLDAQGNPPELHDDLKPCVNKSFSGGLEMIQHPLVHTLYTPIQHGMYNRMYEQKREEIKRYEAERNWGAIIFVLYERPYRFMALRRYSNQMTDEEYWDLVASIWTDSENVWQHYADWVELFKSGRPGRQHMMDEAERKALKRMPTEFTVHRGFCVSDAKLGLSWTTRFRVAEFFAKRAYDLDRSPSRIATGRVAKKDVVAYFEGRSEYEVVVSPGTVRGIRVRKVPATTTGAS